MTMHNNTGDGNLSLPHPVPTNKSGQPPIEKIWGSLNDEERETFLYFVHMIPPVSIDSLSALSGLPAVTTLNIMERLRSRKMVYEKKGHGKGMYFPNIADPGALVKSCATQELHCKVLNRMADFFSNREDNSEDHTLLLADLYLNLGDKDKGLQSIRKAADILNRRGQSDKALSYFDYLIKACENNISEPDRTAIYLDSVIHKVVGRLYHGPYQELALLLEKAQIIAEEHKMWDRLARIKLALGQLLQMMGHHKRASKCMNDFEMLADNITDPRMARTATLAICEYFRWRGLISEAVQRYEEMTGNLEEFGDDEETLQATVVIGFCHFLAGRPSRGMGMIDAVREKGTMIGAYQAALYAGLLGAFAFLDMHKIDEAEICLKRILSLPPYLLGKMTRAAITDIQASILTHRGSYEEAFALQKISVDLKRDVGWIHDNGTCNFERLYILESKGFFCREWDLDSTIAEHVGWDNIHMKGTALRYRALRGIDRKQPLSEILADLKKSEELQEMAGAKFELARTQIVLGDVYLKNGDSKTGLKYLEKAWNILSRIDKNLFPGELLSFMPDKHKMEITIDRILQASESLGTIRDAPSFLEKLLNVAIDFTMATQGTFVSIEPSGRARVLASRNVDPSFFDTPKGDLIRTIILDAAKKGAEIILPHPEETRGKIDRALAETGFTSLIFMPVKLHKGNYGYLCLSNRLDGTPFPDSYLPYVRLFCNQIALGLANIEMYREVQEQKDRLEEEAGFYKREMGIADDSQGRIIGKSEGIERVLEQIRQVAPTTSSVLIQGETGVGKELVAKAIHNLSRRKDGPFIPVNLSSLPQELVASELFGHEKGAFTGAHNRQKGRFELAHGGTIFLDEIGDLPMAIQVKLLRVLQEGSFERLGSARPIGSDFRVIAATNKNLALEVEKGNFRQDLYYRLNVFPIHVPALRDRKEDILLLAQSFIEKTSRKLGKKIQTIPDEEMRKLLNYHWPGNVRELEHFIERAVILSDGYRLNLPDFGGTVGGNAQEKAPIVTMEEMEREHILRVLGAVGWRVKGPGGAALLLNLKPTTLYFRMKKLGIERPTDISKQ